MPKTEAQKAAKKRQRKARKERKMNQKMMDGLDELTGYRAPTSYKGWVKGNM